MLALLAAIMLLAPAKPDPAAPPTPLAAYQPTPQDYVQAAPDFVDHEALLAALTDAGTNWTELAQALDSCPAANNDVDQFGGLGLTYRNMAWLIQTAPHLDRLELTAAMLKSNQDYARYAADYRGYDMKSEFFKRYVLNYRLDDEPVTAWREELVNRYLKYKSDTPGDPKEIAALVIAASAGFKTIERGYFGNLADPVSIDNARAGTERELTLLTAAVLRAMGWGVRYTREGRTGKTWVEVYTGPSDIYDASAWIPVYPTAPEQTGYYTYARELCGGEIGVITAGDAFATEQVTPRYTDVCALVPHIMRGGVEDKEYKHWSIEAWYDGRYVPLDDIAAADDATNPVVGLPEGLSAAPGTYYVGSPGAYLLTAGVRYPGGYVHLITQKVDAQPSTPIDVALCIDPPADLPVAAMAERSAGDGAPQTGVHLYLVIDEKEPSDHTLRLLEPLRATPGLEYVVQEAHASDPQAEQLIEMLKVVPEDPKPVVVLIRDGKTLLYQRGYNLNIFDWVKRALEQ
jgi:hypothetical protein